MNWIDLEIAAAAEACERCGHSKAVHGVSGRCMFGILAGPPPAPTPQELRCPCGLPKRDGHPGPVDIHLSLDRFFGPAETRAGRGVRGDFFKEVTRHPRKGPR